MRFSFTLIAFAGLAASVSAAHLKLVARQYPSMYDIIVRWTHDCSHHLQLACADPCIANADLDGCFSDDNNCLCHSAAFVDSVTACIDTSCSGSDVATAEAVAQEICADVVRARSFLM